MKLHFHKWAKWVDGAITYVGSYNAAMVQTRKCEVCNMRKFRTTNSISGNDPCGVAKSMAVAVDNEGEKK